MLGGARGWDNLPLFYFFWPCCAAYGILVPGPGIEPVPSAVEAPSPDHWTTRDFEKLHVKSQSQQQNWEEDGLRPV